MAITWHQSKCHFKSVSDSLENVTVSDTPYPPSEPATSEVTVKRPRRKGLQIGLRSLFLLTAAVAVWVIYVNNRRNITRLEGRITAMRPLAHELIIDDPNKIAIVKLDEMWFDENRWEIHLPAGKKYRICLATGGIDQTGTARVVKSERLAGGKHLFELEQERGSDGAQLTVFCDRVGLMTVRETKEWDPGTGSTGGGFFSQCSQLAPDQAVILFRRRFSRRNSTGQTKTPDGPTEGVLLWIEPIANSNAEP